MNTVIAPIDFSRASRGVIDEAVRLARGVQGRVVVLYVVKPPTPPPPLAAVEVRSNPVAEEERTARAQLLAMQRRLMKKGISVETVCAIGSPIRCIVQQAQAQAARYIVLGAHGQGALRELVTDGTASGDLKQAGCPVVVVPPGKRAATVVAA
jgi:nucleotide-binding universal stress UspA family protein